MIGIFVVLLFYFGLIRINRSRGSFVVPMIKGRGGWGALPPHVGVGAGGKINRYLALKLSCNLMSLDEQGRKNKPSRPYRPVSRCEGWGDVEMPIPISWRSGEARREGPNRPNFRANRRPDVIPRHGPSFTEIKRRKPTVEAKQSNHLYKLDFEEMPEELTTFASGEIELEVRAVETKQGAAFPPLRSSPGVLPIDQNVKAQQKREFRRGNFVSPYIEYLKRRSEGYKDVVQKGSIGAVKVRSPVHDPKKNAKGLSWKSGSITAAAAQSTKTCAPEVSLDDLLNKLSASRASHPTERNSLHNTPSSFNSPDYALKQLKGLAQEDGNSVFPQKQKSSNVRGPSRLGVQAKPPTIPRTFKFSARKRERGPAGRHRTVFPQFVKQKFRGNHHNAFLNKISDMKYQRNAHKPW